MNNKTVLISGGTNGIGKGAVLQLLEDGFNVATFSRNQEKCDLLQKELESQYDQNRFLVMNGDVTDENDLKSDINATIAKFESIDILINNAGFGYFSDCDTVDMVRFQEMIQTNIVGVARLTQFIVPYMKKQKSGTILNVASISGKVVYPKGEFYSATKFAIMGYSEGIRKELKEYGIKVSTLCPGMIKTDFFSEEELKRREKEWGDFPMMEVSDISRIISLICNQSEHSDIQDVTVMPF